MGTNFRAAAKSETIDETSSGSTGARWQGTVVAISFRPSRAGEAWRKTEEILAAKLTDPKRQIISWQAAPQDAVVATITPTIEGFVEDKEQAIRLRETVILPEIRAGRPIGIDLRQARLITHSFVHALLCEAVANAGPRSQELIHIQAKEPQVRDIVRIVAQYALEDSGPG